MCGSWRYNMCRWDWREFSATIDLMKSANGRDRICAKLQPVSCDTCSPQLCMFVRQSLEVVSAVSGYDCTLPLHLAELLDLACRQEHYCTEIGGQDGQGSYAAHSVCK